MKLFFILLFVSLSAFAQNRQWKSVFIAGDHSINNFDNGRKDLAKMLAPLGAATELQSHLTSTNSELNSRTALATFANINATFANMRVNARSEGCLIFMTSHGAKNQGFYLSRSGILTPATFAQLVNAACGAAPTVILVSACYSGQFITPELQGDNRVILTAAIKDRPSFGCSQDTTHTYWDDCLLQTIPNSQTWKDVYDGTSSCVREKETRLGFNPSLPQAFFGARVRDLTILNQ